MRPGAATLGSLAAALPVPGTYDPIVNLVYLGVGNPCAMFSGEERSGDNLLPNALVALDPDTGKLRWYFQTVPHDVWDLDATTELMLIDTEIPGNPCRHSLRLIRTATSMSSIGPMGASSVANRSSPGSTGRQDWMSTTAAAGRCATPEGVVTCLAPSGLELEPYGLFPQTGLVSPVMDLQQGAVDAGKPERGKLYLGGEVAMLMRGHMVCWKLLR
jgi:hypothetical protein